MNEQSPTPCPPHAAPQPEPTAGGEMDALVAERVMGWTRHPEKMHPSDNRTIGGVLYCMPGYPPYDAGGANVVPYYSTDIAAAWQVVEHFKWRGVSLTIHPYSSSKGYRVGVAIGPAEEWDYATADTAPLAICLAALKAAAATKETT